jgi:hypothetical protein
LSSLDKDPLAANIGFLTCVPITQLRVAHDGQTQTMTGDGMNSALIVMTILGCNDAGTDCHYITTVNQRWSTVEMCDAVSEKQLPSYSNSPYPVIIAVCQKPEAVTAAMTAPIPQAKPDAAIAQPAPTQPPEPAIGAEVSEQEKQSLAGSAIRRVRNVLPTTEGVRTLMSKPVRLVEDSYSWVARRFER